MIKHLAPRSEDEIFESQKDQIIKIAFEKIANSNAVFYKYVNVYVSAHEIDNSYSLFNEIFHPKYSMIYYEVKFKLVANHWETIEIKKNINNVYMHVDWYSTQDLTAGNPMKRPYDQF